jgi:hypothetical protein
MWQTASHNRGTGVADGKAATYANDGLPCQLTDYPMYRLWDSKDKSKHLLWHLVDRMETFLQAFPRPVRAPWNDCVRIHRYKLGDARLIALERNIDYHMSEDLAQAGGNEALEKPIQTQALLKEPAHVYDLRSGKYLGNTASITVELDPWKPSLYALLKEKLPEGVNVSEVLGRGR